MARTFAGKRLLWTAATVFLAASVHAGSSGRSPPDYHARVAEILGIDKASAAPEPAPAPAPEPPPVPAPEPEPAAVPEAKPKPEPKPTLSEVLAVREAAGRGSAAKVAMQLLDLASGGDPAAQYALARLCERGEGLKAPDPAKAVFWADRAAENGSVDALVLLGLYWASGFGVDRDEEAARRAFSRAAAAGDPLGAAFLAATGGAGEGDAALAAGCTLGDIAPFAGLAARAGLLQNLLSAPPPPDDGHGRAPPPLFRAGSEFSTQPRK